MKPYCGVVLKRTQQGADTNFVEGSIRLVEYHRLQLLCCFSAACFCWSWSFVCVCGGRRVATMGQVCFTAISSNRACPTVFIALSSV